MASNFWCNEASSYGQDSVELKPTGLLIIDGKEKGSHKTVFIREARSNSLRSVFLKDKYGEKNGVNQSNYTLFSDF